MILFYEFLLFPTNHTRGEVVNYITFRTTIYYKKSIKEDDDINLRERKRITVWKYVNFIIIFSFCTSAYTYLVNSCIRGGQFLPFLYLQLIYLVITVSRMWMGLLQWSLERVCRELFLLSFFFFFSLQLCSFPVCGLQNVYCLWMVACERWEREHVSGDVNRI